MAEIIDLDFYRKFRIVLPVRLDTLQHQSLHQEKLHGIGHHVKRFRRRRKLDEDPKATGKE